MNNQQVAHLWASGNKENGKGSNFYFEGGTIYSYGNHFPIARRVSEGFYLMTERGYSVSTSRHISYTRQAIPGFSRVFYVPNRPNVSFETIREEKMKQAEDMFSALHDKSPVKTYNNARQLSLFCDDAMELFGFFKKEDKWFISLPYQLKLGNMKTDAIQLMATHQDAHDANEIKKQAQREAREAKRQAMIEENNRILRLSAEEKAQEWREGGGGNCYYSLRILPPMLRIKGDKVETSHGAVVDLEDARKAFAFIGKKIEEGKEWHRNGETCPVGPFSLVSIDSEAVVVGCHRFTIEEVKAFGNLLNK